MQMIRKGQGRWLLKGEGIGPVVFSPRTLGLKADGLPNRRITPPACLALTEATKRSSGVQNPGSPLNPGGLEISSSDLPEEQTLPRRLAPQRTSHPYRKTF